MAEEPRYITDYSHRDHPDNPRRLCPSPGDVLWTWNHRHQLIEVKVKGVECRDRSEVVIGSVVEPHVGDGNAWMLGRCAATKEEAARILYGRLQSEIAHLRGKLQILQVKSAKLYKEIADVQNEKI
jgi:hypothetical protein